MKNNESKEMYLETVYLLEKEHGHAHGVDIASYLGVSKPSVSKAMKSLKVDGLIHQEAYGSITLTHKGRALSESIYYKHKKITKYLEHSLGLEPEDASKNACKMEHVVDEEMLEAIVRYLEKHNLND